MKVFVTKIDEGRVVLVTYSSQRAFVEDNNWWCDPSFIHIATSDILHGFEEAGVGSCIQYTDDEKASLALMREASIKHRRRRTGK